MTSELRTFARTHTRKQQPQVRGDYASALEHLSELSVCKFHDPYTDIDWDAPAHRIAPDDPRFAIADDHPLAQTAWYAQLPAADRARFGLSWMAQTTKYGIAFEAVLSRGLLEFHQSLPDRSPEARYVLHEVIEEARHSQMFQELIDRCGVPTQGISGFDARMDDRVAKLGRKLPCLFFFAVLGGELFIDAQNRSTLKRPKHSVHPLVRLVMKIHVMEEARHVCFAQRYLQQHLPSVPAWRKAYMGLLIPITFAQAAQMMLVPDARLVREFAIPQEAMQQAFGPGSEHRRQLQEATRSVRQLCAQHGLLTPAHQWMWRRCGLLA